MASELEIWTEEKQAALLASMLKWHGTPHGNRVAIPGVCIDCIHLLAEGFAAAGQIDRREFGGYDVAAGVHEPSERLERAIEAALQVEQVSPNEHLTGDIWVMQTGESSGHCGVVHGNDLWHSLAGRCVTKSRVGIWRNRVAKAYRLTATGYRQHPESANGG